MVRTFDRVVDMSPGQRDTGSFVDAADINDLQESIEDLQAGDLPVALAGIEGALGSWAEPASESALGNMRRSRLNALDFPGMDRSGTNDCSSAINYLLEAAGNDPTQGVGGAYIDWPPGEYRIEDQIEIEQIAGSIIGSGRGNSPLYSAGPGSATVFIADCPNGDAPFRVHDSKYLEFGNFRIEGEEGNPPEYGIQCVSEGGEGAGTNSCFHFHDLHLGRWPWTMQGLHKGDVNSGIGFTGNNTNNDESQFERIIVANPAEYGIHFPNTQTVGCSLRDTYIYGAGAAGISSAASFYGSNLNFNDNEIDIEITNTADITISYYYSENARQLFKLPAIAYLSVLGGAAQLQEVIANSEVMIAATPASKQGVTLKDIKFTGMTDASKCRIEIGGVSPTHVGRNILKVEWCEGIVPTQVVFGPGASMWAAVPKSKQVVEFQSTNGDNIYQFRNELRTSGSGTRTTLNYTAWDAPVTD